MRHRRLLLAPPLLLSVAGLLFVLVWPQSWRAGQLFLLRDEMIGHAQRPGYFPSLDEMKTAQETVLEIARNRAVLRRTLAALGPGTQRVTKPWPTDQTIDELREFVQVSATNGSELGKTELIRLSVVAESPERADAFADRLCDEVQGELREVRYQRACSMAGELAEAAAEAATAVEEIAAEIAAFEAGLGADLAELRSLIEPQASDPPLHRNLAQVQAEQRAAETQIETMRKQRQLLADARGSAEAAMAFPVELLNLQPAVGRLKEGLVDAQLRLATLRGEYTDAHPRVRAAIDAVAGIERQLLDELALAVRGIDDQIAINQAGLARLSEMAEANRQQLARLSQQRVRYDQLNQEYRRRDQVLREAQAAVAQAESMRQAARSVDFLARVGGVQVASRPEGMSKRSVVGGCFGLGLLIGIGLLLIVSDRPALAEPLASVESGLAPPSLPGEDLSAGRAAPLPTAACPAASGGWSSGAFEVTVDPAQLTSWPAERP